MKCIKNIKTGEIRRVADLVAWESQNKGWMYIPRSEWKQATRVEVSLPIQKVVTSDGRPRRNREKQNRK